MAELPTLPELVQRKLDVHWEDLCDTHNSYLKLYEMQLARAEVRTGHLKVSYEVAIGEHLVKKTISLAETRFVQTVEEYLHLWASAEDARSQTFAEWLGKIQANTISEIAGVWATRGSCAEFFENACRRRLEEHLRTLVQVSKSFARRLEIQHLENPHLTLSSLVTAGGDLNIAFALEQSNQTLEVAKKAGLRLIPHDMAQLASNAAKVQLERNQKLRQAPDYEFDSLLTDILVLHKTDGRVFENIKGRVSTKGILIMDATLPIETGDILVRIPPNGLRDEFIVDDPGFQSGLPLEGLPAHFQARVRRSDRSARKHASAAEHIGSGSTSGSTREDTLEPAASGTGALASTPDQGRPRRTPDLDSSRERLALVETLARELAIVKQEVKVYCTVDSLKRKHPKFTLWTLIEDSQIKALVDGEEFTPKAYAKNLTLAKFGITSRETLKKDRRKLRKAREAGQQ